MERQILGAKGGGGADFITKPDTLRSDDSFEILFGMGSGRWKGIVDGLQGVRINGVPLENPDGTSNFKDVAVLFADGNPLEDQIVDFKLGGGGDIQSVGVQLSNNSASQPGPWVSAATATPNAEYIDMRFVVQQLFKQDEKSIRENTANIEIEMRPSNSSTWTNPFIGTQSSNVNYDQNGYNTGGGKVTGTVVYLAREMFNTSGTGFKASGNPYLKITGKTSSAYVKEIRIAVPTEGNYANVTWEVRARLREKDTVDQGELQERRIVAFESVTSIINDKLGDHPDWDGQVWMQIMGKASDQFAGFPEIETICDTKICRTPPISVWDPEARTYTGVTWDGSYEEHFTTDPAWQIKEFIEDPIHGVAGLQPGSTLDKWDTLEASKYYSEQVPDGRGGTHARFNLNLTLNEGRDVNEMLQYLAGSVNSYIEDVGDGQWRLIVDKPETPKVLFFEGNIFGNFNYSHSDVDTRFNDWRGTFLNEDLDYEQDTVRVYDQGDIDENGTRFTEIALVGCTNRQEALRRLMFRMRVALNEYKVVTFTTNRIGRYISPLDTILVADEALNVDHLIKSASRIQSHSGTTVTLMRPVRLEVGVNYTMVFTTTDGVVERTVTNLAGARGDVTQIQIDAALPANVLSDSAVSLVAGNLPANPISYRVISVERSESDEDEYAIAAAIIDSGKWNAMDNVSESAILAQESSPEIDSPTVPVDGMFDVITYTTDYQIRRILQVNWNRPGGMFLSGFKVEYRYNEGPWRILHENLNDSVIELEDPEDGFYTFKITALDRRGIHSNPLVGEYEVTGSQEIHPPTHVRGTDAEKPVFAPYPGYRYTVTDGTIPVTEVWDGTQWVPEGNLVTEGSHNGVENGATVGMTPAEQVVVTTIQGDVTQAKTDIGHLFTTYGSTADAATSAAAAGAARDAAQLAKTNSEAAKTAAEAARTGAETAQSDAITKANEAAGSATTAAGHATTASSKADAAAGSALSASGSANVATSKANEAAGSATAAASSATSAASSSTAAGTSASAANQSKLAAEAARDSAAGTSASAALSESSAAASETAAGQSASAAASSELNANTAASNAAASETAAATSETNAAGSASTATTQANLATIAKNAAEDAETNASISQSAAATSASNAANSASSAATSETLAASYRDQTEGQAAAVALTKNASFDAPIVLPDHSVGSNGTLAILSNGWNFSASYQGRNNVVFTTANKGLYGPMTPYVSGRKYRVRLGIRHSVSAMGSAYRFACYNASKAYLGIVVSIAHTGIVGFVDLASSVELSDSNILAGTKYIRPMIHANYTTTVGEAAIDYLYIEDVTEVKAAEASASAASSSAAAASADAATASSQATLAANFATDAKGYIAAPGQTPNAHFYAGTALWEGGYLLSQHFNINAVYDAVPSYQGAINVIRRTGGRSDFHSTPINIDPTRKYRVKARFYVNAPSTQMYIGHTVDDGTEGATVQRYSAAAAQFNTGWHEVVSPIITGTDGSHTSFYATTKRAAAFSLPNYNNAASEYAFDYLYIEDVTAQEDAAAQATIATDQAVIATSQAAAASSSASLAASISQNSLNKNPVFADWADGATVPAGIGTSGLTTNEITRVGDGTNGSPYSLGLNTDGGSIEYFQFPYAQVTAGAHIIEAELDFKSGVINDSRVQVLYYNTAGSFMSSVAMESYDLNSYLSTSPLGNAGRKQYAKYITFPDGVNSALIRVYHRLNNASARHIVWRKVSLRPATAAEIEVNSALPALQASVTTNQGAIAAVEGAAAYYETIVAASGSNPAMVQLKAGKNGSGVGLVADQIALGNEIDGVIETVLSIQNGKATFSDAIIRRLRVAPIAASQIVHEVQLKPLLLLASDGQAVQYQGGASYGQAPDRIEVDIDGAGLPALATGESYDIRATNITATGFTMKAKKNTAAGSETQTSAAGTNVGGTPSWQTNKPTTANAKDELYQFNGTLTIPKTGSYTDVDDSDPQNPVYTVYSTYSGTVKLYGKIGSTWTLLATRTIGRTLTGSSPSTTSVSFSEVIQSGANFGSGSARFGIHSGTGTVTAFTGVTYSTQVTSGEVSVGGNFKVTVYPPTA